MVEQRGVILSGALAQKVVDTVEATINNNVNVMNEHGSIIASSDPQRIGTHHAGSLEAVRAQKMVSIHSADAQAGTLPGVNAPLRFQGRICGVVGVTGAPHEVAALADLIVLTVELLISQEQAHDRSSRLELEAREIISALLAGSIDPEQLRQRLEDIGLSAPWTLTLSHTATASGATNPPVTAGSGQGGIWLQSRDTRWTVKAGPHPGPDSAGPTTRQLQLPARQNTGLLLGDAEILQVLSTRPTLLPAPGQHGQWNMDCAVAVARCPQRSLPVTAGPAAELNQDQFATLAVLSASTSMSGACTLLHVHRNTLIQRIERIRELTGLDPRHPGELFRLLTACYARVALGELHMT